MSGQVSAWVGATGAQYLYYIYEINAKIPPHQGNYIYAKLINDKDWVPIYIGRGDLSLCAGDDRLLLECIASKGATHIHLRCNPRIQDQISETRDLLARFENAFAPHGCHCQESETCVWPGSSKTNYVFYVYSMDEPVPSRPGIYICARRTVDQLWKPLAIGYGDMSLSGSEVRNWLYNSECTHIHRRIELSEIEGRLDSDDILKYYADIVPELRLL